MRIEPMSRFDAGARRTTLHDAMRMVWWLLPHLWTALREEAERPGRQVPYY